MTPAKMYHYLKSLRQEAGFTPKLQISGMEISSPTIVWRYVEGRLHGVAADFWGTVDYFYNGTKVPKMVWTHPEQITIEYIFAQKNAEVRRVCLELYGLERIIDDPRCEHIHVDKENDRDLFAFKLFEDLDPICYVRVRNASPEPNGEYRQFFLCVPYDKNFKTCQEAVAWTFGLMNQDYCPKVES